MFEPCYPPSDIENVFKEYRMHQKRLDVLLNCAGIGRMIGLEDITIQSWDLTMQVNLRAAFFFAREALKMMMPFHYGRIINMASQAGRTGGIMIGMDYSASKGGLLTLTRSLAKIVAPYNITVNSVAPGLVITDMTASFGYDSSTVPLGRIAVPEEIADVTLFVASDLSRYMTGACLDVNGGISMW
jgi:3-oxoacyl-[acyl-carrier protein] reductase